MIQSKRTSLEVQGTAITVVAQRDMGFISLTDMARKFGDDSLIYSWMRNRNSLEFIGIWEQIHNPDFKGIEFETFRKQAGLNSFSLTPRKWIEATGAIIRQGLPQPERLIKLNEIAITQMRTLLADHNVKRLK